MWLLLIFFLISLSEVIGVTGVGQIMLQTGKQIGREREGRTSQVTRYGQARWVQLNT